MKRIKSSNGYENSRRIYHAVNHDRLREQARLQGRNTKDGRDDSYQRNKNDEWKNHLKKINPPEDETQNQEIVDENESEKDEQGAAEFEEQSNGLGIEKEGRGTEYMDEDHHWRMAGSNRSSGEYGGDVDNDES
jgi:hypothetical protein